ncbi:uncharacterized protein LOC126807672 [Patella vulgata]|uniref:uncharacterized protein LOC126807672 n=1 Tax=Patella vulgata TaxID=6465 RepID=UPI00217FEBA1|nr:uncharacterized protein LOC126807672 [Patella vulgata]
MLKALCGLGICVLLSIVKADLNSTIDTALINDKRIIQLDLQEANSSYGSFDQTPWFKPMRWFLVRGDRSNRLLLLIYYYYNFFESFVPLTKNNNITLGDNSVKTHNETKQYLLNVVAGTAFNEVCSMFIKDELGFGILVYHCCKLNENCVDIVEDASVWILRIFFFLVTIFLFLYFPKFLPQKYTRPVFQFNPTPPITLRIVKTNTPDKYDIKGTRVPSIIFDQMKELTKSMRSAAIVRDTVYKVKIKVVDLLIHRVDILSESDQAVSLTKLLYDMIIRCKIRRAKPIKKCLDTPICSCLSRSGKPIPLLSCLNILKTIVIYTVLALPAIPFFYLMSADGLEYQDLGQQIKSRGLRQTSSFYIGMWAGKVITAILCLLYTLYVFIVLMSNSIHEEMADLMTDSINESHKKRTPLSKRVLELLTKPFTKCGTFFVPFFIIGLLLSPLILLFFAIIASPVMQLLIRQCKKLCCAGGFRFYSNPITCGPKVSFFLCLTLLSVFVILTIGFNFLLHAVCIGIINIFINLSTAMSIISLCILIGIYVRDTSSRLTGKYDAYQKSLLLAVLAVKQESLLAESKKRYKDQSNMAFQHTAADFVDENSIENGHVDESPSTIWDVKNGYLRMCTNGIVLFLDRRDIPYIPHAFFHEMTEVICPGCPGTLKSSIMGALKDLGRIVLFLLFLFILLLAYGDTLYVSPTSKLFATIATGLVPLLLRSFFFSKAPIPALDTSNVRFQNIFREKVLKFMMKWPVVDAEIEFTKDSNVNLPRTEVDLVFDDDITHDDIDCGESNDGFVPDEDEELEDEEGEVEEGEGAKEEGEIIEETDKEIPTNTKEQTLGETETGF